MSTWDLASSKFEAMPIRSKLMIVRSRLDLPPSVRERIERDIGAKLAARCLPVIVAAMNIGRRQRALLSGMTVQQRDLLWYIGKRRVSMTALAREREITPSQLRTDLRVLRRRNMIDVTNNVVSVTSLGRGIAKEESNQRQLNAEMMFEGIPYPKRRRIKEGIEILATAMLRAGLT